MIDGYERTYKTYLWDNYDATAMNMSPIRLVRSRLAVKAVDDDGSGEGPIERYRKE